MKASVVDLRYKMNEVLKALDRREKVTLICYYSVSSNARHFKPIHGLKLKIFKP